MEVKIHVVQIEKDKDDQFICGMANFTVYTVDNIFSELLTAVPGIKCGVAMNEAAPRLVRVNGNDERLKSLAARNALSIGAAHAYVVLVRNAYPINILNTLKRIPAVCNIIVATANPVQVLVAETELGRAIIGAVDGTSVTTIENEEQKRERRDLVKKLGYTLE